MDRESIQFFNQYHDILCCPNCGANLTFGNNEIECSQCHHHYQISDNIPLFFLPNAWKTSKEDVTDRIKAFYEDTPFPNYDDFDNVDSLMDRARRGIFAKLLDEQIPFGVRILEAGCGTGQLSIFLSIAHRTVFATDISLNSLRLGQKFKEKNGLERVYFLQMNLFRPVFKPESFHLVICNGVLHHTSDPYAGFKALSSLVKPDGYILIGLYHKYGRLSNDIRRLLFNVSEHFNFIKPRWRNKNLEKTKQAIWFRDQYRNPHESKHTIKEALNWFEQKGFQFVKSLPKTGLFGGISENEKLFKPESPENLFKLFWLEKAMMFKAAKDGGLFIIIGQKKSCGMREEFLKPNLR